MLAGNQLGDEGISRLLPVLSTLPNLGVLDISCNGLTDASLGGLASALEECSSTNNRILQVFYVGLQFLRLTLSLICLQNLIRFTLMPEEDSNFFWQIFQQPLSSYSSTSFYTASVQKAFTLFVLVNRKAAVSCVLCNYLLADESCIFKTGSVAVRLNERSHRALCVWLQQLTQLTWIF